jgi:hypothetical protein
VREDGRSHNHALAAATAAYHEEQPEARAVPLEASARINQMIVWANTDPAWFWKNLPS